MKLHMATLYDQAGKRRRESRDITAFLYEKPKVSRMYLILKYIEFR